MPDLKKQIKENLYLAIKEKNSVIVSTLRMLLAAIINKEKEKKYKEKLEGEAELIDQELIEVIASEAKQRKEAILEFEKGGRQDLVEKEKAELEILKKYLPEQLSEKKLKELIKESINKFYAKEIHPVKSAEGGVPLAAGQFNRVKDLGKVMAVLMPQLKGRADGSQVSQIVKELLSKEA